MFLRRRTEPAPAGPPPAAKPAPAPAPKPAAPPPQGTAAPAGFSVEYFHGIAADPEVRRMMGRAVGSYGGRPRKKTVDPLPATA